MAPTAPEVSPQIPQCGGGPPPQPGEKEEQKDDAPQEQEKKEHCWTCTEEFHCRGEVERSRKKFDWKVVEPYDGETDREKLPVLTVRSEVDI